MITIQHSLRIFGSVLAMSYNGKDTIAVVDNGYNLYMFNKSTFELAKRSQMSSRSELRHKYDKSITSSSKLNMFLSVQDKPIGYLMSAASGLKQIAQINSYKLPYSVAKFSPDGSLLALGDESGMTAIYQMPNVSLLTTLQKRTDYIAAIVFSKDNRYVAVSSFDRLTSIYDFESCRYAVSFLTNNVVESMVFSDTGNEINCVDRSMHIYKYDIVNDELSIGEETFSDWPTTIINIGKNHLLVGARDNSAYLLSSNNLQIQQIIRFSDYGISSFLLIDNLLLIGFTDGEIKIVNIHQNLSEFQIALSLNKFQNATDYVHKNIFLVANEMYSKYDEKWPEVLMEAKELIASGQKMTAIRVVRPFFIDKFKEEEFRVYLGNSKHLGIFKRLVATKEYIKAMLVAEEKEFLKKTDEYKVIENAWQRTFQVAKELLMEEKPDSTSKAQEILQKYLPVKSKTKTINNLFANSQAYISAYKFIRDKNFKDYFLLVQDNAFLETEEIFRRVVTIGTQTFDKMKKHDYEGNIEEAIKIGEYLKVFLPIAQSVEKELLILYAKKELLLKIKENDILAVYSSIETLRVLENYKPFRHFHMVFLKIKAEAIELAQKAAIKSCFNLLQPYMSVPYLSQTIYKIVETAYIAEIERVVAREMEAEYIDWNATYNAIVENIGNSDKVLLVYRNLNIDKYIRNHDIQRRDSIDPSIILSTSIIRYAE